MNVFFVYIDWTLENLPRAFYIGKGLLDRVQTQERNNDHWRNIAAKHGFRREVILATKDESYAFVQEILGILEHGTFCGSTQHRWGANKTAGGEGCTGHRFTWTEIQRDKKRGDNNASKRQVVRDKIRRTLLLSRPLTGIRKPLSTLEKRSKITRLQAEEIRTRCAAGETQQSLAVEFGLAKCSINNIVHGRKWKQDL